MDRDLLDRENPTVRQFYYRVFEGGRSKADIMAAADMVYTRGGGSDDRGESMVWTLYTH